MNTELPISKQNKQLLARSLDSAVQLDQQLNLLLDAYDFFLERYGESRQVTLADLQTSLKELSTLPKIIALHITSWRVGMLPDISSIGFELNVLNEIMLHMNSMHRAFGAVGIDMGAFSPSLVKDCMNDLKLANTVFGVQQY
jgi:hypothetical protein